VSGLLGAKRRMSERSRGRRESQLYPCSTRFPAEDRVLSGTFGAEEGGVVSLREAHLDIPQVSLTDMDGFAASFSTM